MSLDQILAITNFFQFGMLFKLFLLVVVLFYFVLTIIIYRQISLMTQILESKISPLIKGIAVLQIIAVGFLFLLAIALA